MVNIVNAGTLGGGFRHYQGLVPVNLGSGNPFNASVRIFHVTAANAAAIFRGDIVCMSSAAIGVQGAADLPFNITAPSASVVVGGGGGTGLGNTSMAPNVTRWVPGDVAATTIIAGVVVGFGPITLYQAKNGFQYIPANTEAWLAVETEQNLEKVIREYGEERFAFQIAKAIAARRAIEPISSTRQLAEIVAHAVKTREKGKDPATRTFQAIRIFINQELEDLEAGLKAAFELLAPGGRLSVISFHSLEDRMVKQFLASKAKVEQPDRRLPIRAVDLPQPLMKLIAKVKPSDAEVDGNPRARSAVMRVAERLGGAA